MAVARIRSLLPTVSRPTVAQINEHGAKVIVAAAVPTFFLMYRATTEPMSEKDVENLELERTKRRGKLEQMVICARETVQKDADARGLLQFADFLSACGEVQEIEPTSPLLGEALGLASVMLARELAEAERRTAAGEALYRDGEELSKLLEGRTSLSALVAGLRGEQAEVYKARASAELVAAVRLARVRHWRLRSADLMKSVRLLLVARGALPYVLLSTLLSAASGALSAWEMLYRTLAIEVFRRKDWQWGDFTRTMRAVILLRGLSIVVGALENRLSTIGEDALIRDIQTALYKALLRQDFEWYKLGRKDQRDVREIFGEILSNVPGGVREFLMFPSSIIHIFVNAGVQLSIVRERSSRLLNFVMGVYWAQFLVGKLLGLLQTWVCKRILNKHIQPHWMMFVEPLMPENLPTVRSFAAEGKAISAWKFFFASNARRANQAAVVNLAFSTAHDAVSQSGTVTENLWCGKLVRDGHVAPADMQTLVQFTRQVSSEMAGAAESAQSMQESLATLAKAWDLVSLRPSIGIDGGLCPAPRATGEVSFRGVHFRYDTGMDVLKGVDLHIPAGTVCGITGTSGCGKSTLLKLLERMYDPQEGTILLDGVDVRELNPSWLRRQCGVVMQKPRFFHMTLRENLCYGCGGEVSDARIEEACRAAHVHELVFQSPDKFPAGLYTHMPEVSGGELQRLSIARALLVDAPILLLDEGTSALDSESQAAVAAALENLMRGRTVISVAHRLEAIRAADNIAVMHEGTVVEQGTHTELVQREGFYARLNNKQSDAMGDEEEDGDEQEGAHVDGEGGEAGGGAPQSALKPPGTGLGLGERVNTVTFDDSALERADTSVMYSLGGSSRRGSVLVRGGSVLVRPSRSGLSDATDGGKSAAHMHRKVRKATQALQDVSEQVAAMARDKGREVDRDKLFLIAMQVQARLSDLKRELTFGGEGSDFLDHDTPAAMIAEEIAKRAGEDQEVLRKLATAFQQWDRDGNMRLDAAELRAGLQSLGIAGDSAEVRGLLGAAGHGGAISLAEWFDGLGSSARARVVRAVDHFGGDLRTRSGSALRRVPSRAFRPASASAPPPAPAPADGAR